MARVDVKGRDGCIWVDRVPDLRDDVVHVHVHRIMVPAVRTWRTVHVLRELLSDCGRGELGYVDVLALFESVVVEGETGRNMFLDNADMVRAALVVIRVGVHGKDGDRGESGKLQKTLRCRVLSAGPVPTTTLTIIKLTTRSGDLGPPQIEMRRVGGRVRRFPPSPSTAATIVPPA